MVLPQSEGLSDLGRRHVVQKDHIYAVNFGKSARLLQIIGLDFNTHVWSLLTKLLNSISKTGKPSERGQMIVFYEHHVVQAKAMINTTPCDHRSLSNARSPAVVLRVSRILA